jgi:hypothetical protein
VRVRWIGTYVWVAHSNPPGLYPSSSHMGDDRTSALRFVSPIAEKALTWAKLRKTWPDATSGSRRFSFFLVPSHPRGVDARWSDQADVARATFDFSHPSNFDVNHPVSQ